MLILIPVLIKMMLILIPVLIILMIVLNHVLVKLMHILIPVQGLPHLLNPGVDHDLHLLLALPVIVNHNNS